MLVVLCVDYPESTMHSLKSNYYHQITATEITRLHTHTPTTNIILLFLMSQLAEPKLDALSHSENCTLTIMRAIEPTTTE